MGNWKREPEPGHRRLRTVEGIRRERHDLDVELVECGLVLLEVSQLLTTVASPVSAVEKQDAVMSRDRGGEHQLAAIGRAHRHVREALANSETFHTRCSRENQAAEGTSFHVRLP